MPNDPYAPPASKIDGDTSLAVASFNAKKMEVNYANRMSDLVVHNIFAIWRSPLFFIIYTGMILLIAYTDAYDRSGIFHVSWFLWGALQTAFYFTLGLGILSLLQYGIAVMGRSRDVLIGDRRAEVSEEGFTEESSTRRTLIKWNGIYRVSATPRFLKIHVSSLSVYLIPRRAFSSREDSETFLKIARHFYDAANGKKQ